MFRDDFWWIDKYPHYGNFGNIGKVLPFLSFLQIQLKIWNLSKFQVFFLLFCYIFWRKKHKIFTNLGFFKILTFRKVRLFLANILLDLCVCIINAMNLINKYFVNLFRFRLRPPQVWSLLFCRTYKFICNMWCVMRDVMCDNPYLIFCKSLSLFVKGRPKVSHLRAF